jgi:hypothetical protein
MAEGHELLTQEHGVLASLSGSLGALLMAIAQRLLRKEGPPKESKEQRENRLQLERDLEDAREKLLEARFDRLRSELRAEYTALITAERTRVDNLQHENGSQGEQLKTAQKDINNLWRRERGEEPK